MAAVLVRVAAQTDPAAADHLVLGGAAKVAARKKEKIRNVASKHILVERKREKIKKNVASKHILIERKREQIKNAASEHIPVEREKEKIKKNAASKHIIIVILYFLSR